MEDWDFFDESKLQGWKGGVLGLVGPQELARRWLFPWPNNENVPKVFREKRVREPAGFHLPGRCRSDRSIFIIGWMRKIPI